MYKKKQLIVLNNFILYIGLVITGFVGYYFLDFNNEWEIFFLFLVLFIVTILIAYQVEFLFKRLFHEYKKNSNKSIATYFIVMLVLRIFPHLYPKSFNELFFFLTVIFIFVTIKESYFIKNIKQV